MSAAARTQRGSDREPVAAPAAQLVREAVGEALRRHYADLLEEPIPPRLLVLLAELEAREAERGRATSGAS